MIFITTGSRSFQFNRLLEAVDNAIESGEITDEVFAQIGSSNYPIKNYKYKEFLTQEELLKRIFQLQKRILQFWAVKYLEH